MHIREAVRETRPNKKIDFRFNFFYVFFLEAHLKRSQTVNFEKLKISTSSWTSVEMPKNDNFEIFNFFLIFLTKKFFFRRKRLFTLIVHKK